MKKIYLLLLFTATTYLAQAQVKIGDNPTIVGASSALELESANKALVITRVANTAAIASPVEGMIIYDISSNCIKSYEDGKWTNCLSNGSNIEPSTNGTAVVSSYVCSTGSTGTLSAGVAVSSVTQTITATVTQLGTYSLNTFANGVVFSASGTFTSLGSQTIVLTAIGIPVDTGSNIYTLNTIPNCSFSRTTLGNPSSGGTAIVSGFTCNTASAGTPVVGTELSGVTQTITATVTTAGTYNITATTNGIIFTGTGTFASTGAQNVELIATGIPTTAGSNSFTLSTTPNCSFTRTVISATSGGTAVVSAYTCNTASAGNLVEGTAALGVTQTITATVTNAGTYNISIPQVNGVSWAASGTFAGTGNQPIVLTASGTPTAIQQTTFNLPTTPTCSFSRFVYGDGSSSSKPSLSCNYIKTYFPSRPDGVYWIDPDWEATGFAPMQCYCDMTTDGGGWTLLAVNGSSGFSATSSPTVTNQSTGAWLPRATVIALANNASQVQLRTGASSGSVSNKVTSSVNGGIIAALRSPSTVVAGPGTWHGLSAQWTVNQGSWCWTATCPSQAAGWPNMYHSCGSQFCVHWTVSTFDNRFNNPGDPWAGTYIR